MFKLNRVLGGVLLALTCIAGPMARADDEKPVHLLVKPKVGHVTHSKSVVKTSVMGMELIITSIDKDVVKEVKENGDVVYESGHESGTISVGGKEQEQPVTPATTKTHDKFGKLKDYKGKDNSGFTTPEIDAIMESITTLILTDKPVKTSDTWDTELDNPAVKEKKVVVKGTYLGTEKIDGKDYWKIKQTTEAVVDADGSKIGYDFTDWIDPVNGDTLKSEGTVKDVPTQFGVLTMHVSTKAVKADSKDKPKPAKP